MSNYFRCNFYFYFNTYNFLNTLSKKVKYQKQKGTPFVSTFDLQLSNKNFALTVIAIKKFPAAFYVGNLSLDISIMIIPNARILFYFTFFLFPQKRNFFFLPFQLKFFFFVSFCIRGLNFNFFFLPSPEGGRTNVNKEGKKDLRTSRSNSESCCCYIRLPEEFRVLKP